MSTRHPDDEQPELTTCPKTAGWSLFWLDILTLVLFLGCLVAAARCSIGSDSCAALSAWT